MLRKLQNLERRKREEAREDKMAKEKACKQCKSIYEGSKCPACGSSESVDSFKGKVVVLNPEKSEIAKNLGINEKGVFAIRLR